MRWPALLALALVACGDADEASQSLDDAGTSLDTTDAERDCDEDGDGFLSVACGGNDCCDSDPLVHPGQENFFDKPSKCGSWDYDCSGAVEREIELPAAECRRQGDPDGIACYGYAFEGSAWHALEAPECGEQGKIIEGCDEDCFPVKSTISTQRCR